jgi:BirA family transcriptional regulator, biotin operon repressor / biotin---[acetyl-CoA-carboxylase] ligase
MPEFPSPVALPDDVVVALDRARGHFSTGVPRVLYFPSVTSTNDVAARMADLGAPDGTVIVAEMQAAGRGRLGRTWFSPPGAGLYASVILRPVNEPDAMSSPADGKPGTFFTPMITLAAGVALAEAVRGCNHLPVDIKWPNDLVVGRRKLAGILAEAAAGGGTGHVILGFGINLRSAAYPPEIADRATSIEAELGRAIDRGTLLVECLASLAAWNQTLRAGRTDAILDRWRSLAPSSRGAGVEWTTVAGTASGVTDGIDGEGALVVRTSSGIERIIAGEIRWL